MQTVTLDMLVGLMGVKLLLNIPRSEATKREKYKSAEASRKHSRGGKDL